jgi:hypothetical protein
VPQERGASPDLESLRPVLTVMSGIQARYVFDLRQAGHQLSGDLAARLALADERGTDAVAADPANPVLVAERATAFGAALWSALTALPDHSANEHRRLLHAAYAAHARLEAGEDGSGLVAALASTRSAAALAGGGATPAEDLAVPLADHLVSALGAVTASAAVLDPSLTGE